MSVSFLLLGKLHVSGYVFALKVIVGYIVFFEVISFGGIWSHNIEEHVINASCRRLSSETEGSGCEKWGLYIPISPEMMKIGFEVFGKAEGGGLYKIHQEYMADLPGSFITSENYEK